MSNLRRDRLRLPQDGLLANRAVFLSASIPVSERAPRYQGFDLDPPQVEIESAVIEISRALLAEGALLTFGGHPSISPLVAMVAGEYTPPPSREGMNPRRAGSQRKPPVLIHQLTAYEASPSITKEMERLGQARIIWHPLAGAERARSVDSWPANGPAFPISLRLMREALIELDEPAAMVCVGGMEGVEEEAALFHERFPRRPVYALEGTGGAAALIGATIGQVDVVDSRVIAEYQRIVAESGEASRDYRLRYPPYAAIAQEIVRDLVERNSHTTQ